MLLALATAALVGWSAWDEYVPGTGSALVTRVGVDILVATAGAGLLAGLAFVTIGRWAALPWTYLWTLVTCLVLLLTLGSRSLRSTALHLGPVTQPVLRTHVLALAKFEPVSSGFDPTDVRSVSLVFDAERGGAVLVDDIGLAPGVR